MILPGENLLSNSPNNVMTRRYAKVVEVHEHHSLLHLEDISMIQASMSTTTSNTYRAGLPLN